MPDIARLSTPPCAYELKCYTCFNQVVALGHGSTDNGGAPSSAEGHIYAFGCTAERLCKLVFGLKQIGDEGDRPFSRATREGFVAACDGQYADAQESVHGR